MAETQTEVQVTEIQKLSNNKEIIAYLAEKFPLCFSLKGEAKPIKVGLFQDLVEVLKDDPKVSKTQLRYALRQYTSNWRYLHGCKEGACRVDLQGNPAGVLEQKHVEHAAQQLAEAKAKIAEKRAADPKKTAEPKIKKKYSPHKQADNKQHQKSTKKPIVKNVQPKAKTVLNTIELTHLQKGNAVKVKVGENAKNATVLEVSKENIRVELENGLVISVTPERLFV